jgi:IS5 family transposase
MSDYEVVQTWTENIYFQVFTGSISFCKTKPCDPSTLSYFRSRIGSKGSEIILKHSVLIHGESVLESEAIIDSTVQPKYITFPTESGLTLAVIKQCWKFSNHLEFSFDTNYEDEVSSLRKNINFLKNKKDIPSKELNISRLKDIANDLLTQLPYKVGLEISSNPNFKNLIHIYRTAVNQKKHDSNKIYSIFEPDVACIAKGKYRTKYEFGSKVSLIIGRNHKIILGVKSFKGAPYDGNTIEPTLDMIRDHFNGYQPSILIGDLGYRGDRVINGVLTITPDNYRKVSTLEEKLHIGKMLSDRSAIEPIIGHLKFDHNLGLNKLHGFIGDEVNALLSAAAFNLKKYARIEDQKLVVACAFKYGKHINHPKRKTKSVPFYKPSKQPRLIQ